MAEKTKREKPPVYATEIDGVKVEFRTRGRSEYDARVIFPDGFVHDTLSYPKIGPHNGAVLREFATEAARLATKDRPESP